MEKLSGNSACYKSVRPGFIFSSRPFIHHTLVKVRNARIPTLFRLSIETNSRSVTRSPIYSLRMVAESSDLNEKGVNSSGISPTSSSPTPPAYSNSTDAWETLEKPSWATRNGLTADSFKRRRLADGSNQLNQTMKTRHLHMIAIGGSIGAGLFVGSGSALSTGGPGSLLLDFSIIGIMIFNVGMLLPFFEPDS